MELLRVDTIEHANEKVKNALSNYTIPTEIVPLSKASERVLATDVFANEPVPAFNRSTVDGYAVYASSVFGASESSGVFLELIGQAEMGKVTHQTLQKGQAIYVPTGGMIPEGGQAVVMIEHTEVLDDRTIVIYQPVAPGSNIMIAGEDMQAGELILRRGSRLRPQDIGALAAIGMHEVCVCVCPRVSIFSTGDEIIAPNQKPELGQIRDINGFVTAALIERAGGIVVEQRIIPDQYDKLKNAVEHAMKNSDVIILSGGSSVGKKDMTARVLNDLGTPGILTHGIAIKPGKPTIIASAQGRMLIGLPGHPVSSMMVFEVIVRPMLELMQGHKAKKMMAQPARLDANVHASPGRRNFQMVTLSDNEGNLVASPILGKSGAITLLSKADGFFIISEDLEGVYKDSMVDVYLF